MGGTAARAFVSVMLLAATGVQAGRLPTVDYPADWRQWPVVKEGRIPGEGQEIDPDLPQIVRETFRTYAWVNDGKGSAYAIRMDPDKLDSGDYGNGPTAVFHVKASDVLLVTGHLAGTVSVYGVYTTDGKDISGAHPSLERTVCRSCHASHGTHSSSGFSCEKGICSQ